ARAEGKSSSTGMGSIISICGLVRGVARGGRRTNRKGGRWGRRSLGRENLRRRGGSSGSQRRPISGNAQGRYVHARSGLLLARGGDCTTADSTGAATCRFSAAYSG